MGDDEVNQHVYKFVSADDRHSMHKRRKSPLDEGTLYVARFNADGSGEWLPLVHGNGPLTAANGFAEGATSWSRRGSRRRRSARRRWTARSGRPSTRTPGSST